MFKQHIFQSAEANYRIPWATVKDIFTDILRDSSKKSVEAADNEFTKFQNWYIIWSKNESVYNINTGEEIKLRPLSGYPRRQEVQIWYNMWLKYLENPEAYLI